MTTSRAVVTTTQGSRYLQQLCKHWAHKFETEFTPQEGRISLPSGEAHLRADDGALTVELKGRDGADMTQFQGVVQSHIERFAFRETLAFDWT